MMREIRRGWKKAMRLMLLLLFVSMAVPFTVAQTFAPGTLTLKPPQTLDPESIEGPWEIASPSGIDGIFFKVESFHPELRVYDPRKPIDKKIVSQEVEARVYHRERGRETRGWFPTTPRTRFTFDGQHLEVHALFSYPTEIKSFDLDVIRAPDGKTWSGTVKHDGQTFKVVLERPHPAEGAKLNAFVGDWEGDDHSERGLGIGSLHISQSSDGTLAAWLDRTLGGVDQRNGESLQIMSATRDGLMLRTAGAGPTYLYDGALSKDGDELAGMWAMDHGGTLNAQMHLNAPMHFRRKL